MRCLITLRQIKLNRILQIIYPLIVYFVVYQLGVSLLIDAYGDKIGKLMCLLIAGTICIIPMYIIYRTVPKIIPEQFEAKRDLVRYLIWIFVIVFAGIALNIILTKSGMVGYSKGFERANQTLSDGSLFIKLLCNALIIPILEELLIRGIITGQLCLWYGSVPAVVLSSFCFGIMHNNIVQFIYALAIGLLLGLMYTKTRRLILCILAHGLLNLLVILFS